MDINELVRAMNEMRNDLRNEISKNSNQLNNLSRKIEQMDATIHDFKIELDAKIDSKTDKVRSEIVDLNTTIENRFTLLTEQVDLKVSQINEKIDNNKSSTDASIANISQEVNEINEKFNRFLLLDFNQRVEDAIKPTINQMREAHQNVLETMEELTQAMDELVKRETVTPRDFIPE